MIVLLDVNVLVARVDPAHEFHRRALAWLGSLKNTKIATCPLTENGFLRIYGNPIYPQGAGSPAVAAEYLAAIRRLPQHVFLPDDISLADRVRVPSLAGAGHQQLTDVYLLALAVKHHARFATFDQRIDAGLVIGGAGALVEIA